MQVTFDLPDDIVAQLHPFEDKLPQILELGLRELNAMRSRSVRAAQSPARGEFSPFLKGG